MTKLKQPISKGTTFIDLNDSNPVGLVEVDEVWIDEDGNVQVSIMEYDDDTIAAAHTSLQYTDSKYGHRTVTKDDVIDRLTDGDLFFR